MTKANALEETKKNEIAVINFEEDAGLGHENVSLADRQMPYINLLQALSPMLDEDDPSHIEGAKEGSIFITDSKTIVDGKEGIKIIPCRYKRHFCEWIPREQGGGLVAMHSSESPLIAKAHKVKDPANPKKTILQTPDGNTLVETAQFFVLAFYNNEWHWAVLNMSGTKWSAARELNTLSTTRKIPGTDKLLPTFTGIYSLTSFKDQNKTGQKYANFKVAFDKLVDDPVVYALAKEYYNISKNLTVLAAEDATESQEVNY